MKNINELIENNLKLLFDSEENKMLSVNLTDINNNRLTQSIKGERFANELAERGLIKVTGDYCILEEFGFNIARNGGWIKYLEDSELKEKNKQDKLDAEFENLKSSTEVNKFLLKTKWLPHIVATLSFLFSIYVYFDARNDSKKLNQKIDLLENIIKNLK